MRANGRERYAVTARRADMSAFAVRKIRDGAKFGKNCKVRDGAKFSKNIRNLPRP